MINPSLTTILAALLFLAWLLSIYASGATRNRGRLRLLMLLSLVVPVVVLLVPVTSWSAVDRFLAAAGASRSAYWILGLAAFAIGGVYARFQRVWPFDEEENFNAAVFIRREGIRSFFRSYGNFDWLGQQHPPLSPLSGALFIRIFGGSLFAFRLLSVGLGVGVVLITAEIGRILFAPEIGFFAGLFLMLFPLFFRMAGAALLEMPVTFFTVTTLYLSLIFTQLQNPVLLVLMGFAIGLGLWTKYSMVFVPVILFSGLLLDGDLVGWVPLIAATGIGLSIGAVWFAYAYYSGIIRKQFGLIRNYTGAVKIESGERDRRWNLFGGTRNRYRLEALLTRLPSAIGPYNFPLIFFGAWVIWQQGSDAIPFLAGWTLPIIAILVFSLPDHRYFLQIFPAFAIIAAAGLNEFFPRSPLLFLLIAYSIGSLWLFVDWYRSRHLFLTHVDTLRKLAETR